MPTFNLANRIKVTNKASNVDETYGPYDTVSEANAAIVEGLRDIGRTVIINVAGTAVEYWWESGVEDSDLVEKVLGTDTGIPAILSDGTSPTLNTGISAAEVRSLIGAGTGSGTSNLVIGTTSTTAMAGNTTTITSAQATAIANNSNKVSDTGVPAVLSNGTTPSLNSGISAAEMRGLIGAGTGSGTSNLVIGTTSSTALAGNTVTISNAQANAITTNTAKVGITTQQANAIIANTAKVTFPGLGTTSSTALAGDTTTISSAQATAINDSVKNNTDTYTGTAKITQIVSLSNAEYQNISSPSSSTLYIIL